MAYTAECLHRFHSACRAEDACDCSCHEIDRMNDAFDDLEDLDQRLEDRERE